MSTIGFISPPSWFDPSPGEFPSVCMEEVRVQQTILPPPEFSYTLEGIAATGEGLVLCARLLRAAGCDVIAQVGTPFAWAQ